MGNCVTSVIDFFHSSFLSRGNSSTSTDPQCRTELEISSTSTALQRQMELRDSSTCTDRQPQMEMENPSTSTALQHQMELGDSSISIDRQPQMDLKNSSTSTALQPQMELKNSSTSTALQPQMELENSSTSTDLQCPTELENSSTSTVLQCQMELGDSSTSTDRQCRMELENFSTTSALQRQMELGDSSTSTTKQMELGDSSTSTAWQRQMELGDSSISTGRQMEMVDSSTSIVLHHQRESAKAFDGIVPEASLSYSTLRKKGPFDVFINHRGCDVKLRLASTIYHTLDLVGLRAFLDLEELELGDCIPQELEEVMSTAGLHIAIFSEKYAESAWCLAELSFMLKTRTPILPVFYHVKPEDLRWVDQGKGLYAPAFSKHEDKGRYPSSMLKEWKTALERVSYFSGYMLNSSNGDEGMLLKSIVNSVLKVIKKEPLEVAKHPVGMDEIVEDFERRRQECSESEQQVQIVGIVGFGGSGKTTLGTELYNRKSSSFNLTSFLHDVRDAASKNALHTKQKKLLKDLRIQTRSFDNVREGKRILEKRLKSLCVLIVLDDVDQEDQLDALLPPKESLGPGSLVIVTTREGGVLTTWGITSIYRMQPLQHFHAKQLFCWHAFLQPFPQEGFEDLVENFLHVCSGLPLSLKVIGGQLYGRTSTKYWYAQLEKIGKTLPTDIKASLKVSFDALEPDEQEVFLDIACFFIGEETSLGVTVWDGSGWSGLCSLETLLNKCLVEVDKEGSIRMHDHLRDLGREVATTRSPSRIWFQRQSVHIQRGMPIRGIIAATGLSKKEELPGCPPPFKEYMEMMSVSNLRLGLQILVAKENDFTPEFGDLSRGLLWLRWFDFGQSNLPSWLSLENIRVLQLIGTYKLETLWEDAHPPLELRELVIRDALKLQSFPRSIGRLKHLRKLSLVGLYKSKKLLYQIKLSSLPEEFCELHSLEQLDLEGCELLQTLPGRFGDLKSLRHINLSSCSSLETLPESFKQLINLEFLNLSYCKTLELESNVLENITNLKVFNVSGCRMLQVLPHNITNQASLGELDLRGTSSLRELPATIGHLSKLEKLEIDSPLLTRLPSSLGNLSSLATLKLFCDNLESLPVEVRQLSNLKNLIIRKCSLKELDFGSGLRLPSSLRELKEIYLSGTSVSRISLPQDGCPSLETLIVEDCPSLTEIETLPTALRLIEFRNCKMLESIGSPEAFEQLSHLQTLRIGDCSIKELAFGRGSSSSSLQMLREIYISGTSVSRISFPQGCCSSLETLSVKDCASLMEIETLPTTLELIELRGCIMLESIGSPEAFEQLSHLQTLRIRDCSIRELAFGRGSSSSSLQMLREIYISGTSVSRISLPQGCCSSLETLRVEDCASLLEIDTLPTALKLIELSRCKVLESIGSPEAFEQLSNLQTLKIKECSIRELAFGRGSSSSSLQMLREIYKSGTSVSRISLPQGCCSSLETLRVKDSASLLEIDTLPTALELIKLSRCKVLESIGSPEAFEQLSNLQTQECSIRELPFGRGSSSSLCNLRHIHLEATHLSMVSISQECYPTLHELQIHNEEYLREIETLPAALKSITLNKCKMLKNIRGIHTVVNVQKLSILNCPEFDEMPSLAGLVSLDNLEVRDCHKIKKIEGLEHLTSLKELIVQTWWMVPGIDSLGRTERLQRLNLQADTISAFEPCIQSIQIENWPREMTISAGIFPGVCSILDSFTFPGLTVVNSFESSDYTTSMEWSLTCAETNLSNAAIVWFLVDCCHEGSFLKFWNGNYTAVRLSKGGVVVIRVFARVSPLVRWGSEGPYLKVSMEADTSEDKWHDDDGVKRGSLITGERGSVFEAFKRLFQTLCKATSMT